MKKIPDEIKIFLENQGFVIVSTIDSDGSLHNSCKGIININQAGKIYLMDVYLKKTYQNLKANPRMSITAVDEHKFKGYCLKGKGNLLERAELSPQIIKAWENKLATRITQRLLKNIREGKGHPRHPEALLPKPEYVIVMQVDDIIDLTPHHLKLKK